ncbi:hypothetical protein [Amycolatopsis sp. CA-126428]|uniref:hypothetical protein n=1 Tax=Amycolatopsis sp. CA-126428 TaxID=2073158 RepID=UPI001E477A60|nr:hypothetical protein [Amycolatopsis sp. CA-126428]
MVARLENELGTPLFDRAGRLRLNDAGQLFRGYVEREFDAGRRAVADAMVRALPPSHRRRAAGDPCPPRPG